MEPAQALRYLTCLILQRDAVLLYTQSLARKHNVFTIHVLHHALDRPRPSTLPHCIVSKLRRFYVFNLLHYRRKLSGSLVEAMSKRAAIHSSFPLSSN
jgi:hypothetical protein